MARMSMVSLTALLWAFEITRVALTGKGSWHDTKPHVTPEGRSHVREHIPSVFLSLLSYNQDLKQGSK